ncbi:MAG: hypothetical protein F7B61_06235 [Caldisphaeraceae archaeon]|nr:hypothetical protein [Caldisphaeraceae archaeon]
MAMWLGIAILFMGLLSALDVGIYTYIAYATPVTPLQYGIIGGVWSVTFILSNLLFGKYSDKGRNRLLMIFSFAAIAITAISFSFHGLIALVVAYVFEAISTSASNLAIFATIFELKDSRKWGYYTEVQRFYSYLIRGISLTPFLFIGGRFSFDYLIYFTALAGLASLLTLPPLRIKLERSLYSLDKGLDYITSQIKLISYSAYGYAHLFPKVMKTPLSGKVSSGRNIALSLFFATLAGDYIFTSLPLLVRSYTPLGSLWFAYGAAGIVMAFSLLLVSMITYSNKGSASLAILFRGVWLVAALFLIKYFYGLIVYVAVSYMLFSILDVILYNCYSEASSGYGSHAYYMARELGTLVGSVIIGFTFTRGYAIFILPPILSTLASIISIFL